MLPRKMPALLVVFLALLGMSAVNSVGAQVFDLDKGRVALTMLDGLCGFTPATMPAGPILRSTYHRGRFFGPIADGTRRAIPE
jgi:hypothetical protein